MARGPPAASYGTRRLDELPQAWSHARRASSTAGVQKIGPGWRSVGRAIADGDAAGPPPPSASPKGQPDAAGSVQFADFNVAQRKWQRVILEADVAPVRT